MKAAWLACLLCLPAPAWAKSGDYQSLTLGELGAFPYDVPDAYSIPVSRWLDEGRKKAAKKPPRPVIPEAIKKLDGSKVAISGFMMPFDVEEGGVITFSLVKSIMNCCYGLAPRVNETIMCKVAKGQRAKFYINVPIQVSGTLAVGEVKEDGYVLALYSLAVDSIEKIEHPDAAMMQGAGRMPASSLAIPPSGPPKAMARPTSGSEP